MKIKAQKRDVKGKKVKNLRNEGNIPAVIYGPNTEPKDIVISNKEFTPVFKDAGTNKLIEIETEGGKKPSLVLIKEVQMDYVKDQFLHVSFYEVDEKTKITTQVPVVLEGVSMAVKNNLGFLVNPMDALTVRCLPHDIPEVITISIDTLDKVGDSITLADIKLPENVNYLTTADQTTAIAYIAPPQKEIVEEEVAETTETEGEESEGASSEDGAEDDETSEESKE